MRQSEGCGLHCRMSFDSKAFFFHGLSEQIRSLCWVRHAILTVTSGGHLVELDVRKGEAQVAAE